MNSKSVASIALSLLLFAIPSNAHAEEPATSDAEATPAPRVWYGWQTLTADGISALVGGTGIVTSLKGVGAAEGLMAVGFASFELNGPVIHLANGQWKRAAGSAGLRWGLPAAGLVLGFLVGEAAGSGSTHPACTGVNCNDWGAPELLAPVAGALIGSGIGMISASIVDASWLAYKPAPIRARRSGMKLALVPRIDPRQRSYGVSLVGSAF
jgi:hypothetical protein